MYYYSYKHKHNKHDTDTDTDNDNDKTYYYYYYYYQYEVLIGRSGFLLGVESPKEPEASDTYGGYNLWINEIPFL